MLSVMREIQSVLLLGGKSDLALATLAKLPISEDARVILCGRDMNAFEIPETLSIFQVQKVEVDLANITKAKLIIDEAFEGGCIDLAIIAYATLGSEEFQLNQEVFAEVLHNNFYSQALLLNQINSRMRQQMSGQILQISSVAGIRPRKVNFVYGASKFGVDFIAQGLQKQNVGSNVFVTILRPGFVHTRMTRNMSPAPFATNESAVAKIAAKGIRKKKRIVYAPRILLLVMFILKFLPERIFRILDK